MPTVPVYNTKGSQVGEIALKDNIFAVKVNKALLHEAVVMQLASRRQGTASVKNRSAVRGGGRKPWKQKGTGQARAGSRRSPLWTGGGIIFGPTPRDYDYNLPKKARRQALKSALSSKVEAGEIIVVDAFNFSEPKTKAMAGILSDLKVNKALIVTADVDNNLFKSAQNISGVVAMVTEGLNVYDILAYDHLVITKDAVGKVEEALA
ncbi:MAG TPA: 50S ribosomal protein L4 [Firmicutes bacterium]|nr:50S ribosomal protein L4 [Bacillota bacterium]